MAGERRAAMGTGTFRRRAGMTMLEMAVASAITMLIAGSIAVVFTAMTRGTADAEMNLLAQSECERGLLALVEDLQTTDSVGKDSSGVPYFQIENRGAGTANSIVFRRVEGFTADPAQDLVAMVFGQPIRYSIEAGGDLVREQGGRSRVVANRAAEIRFSVAVTGRITVELATFTGREGSRVEARSSVQVSPRNALKL